MAVASASGSHLSALTKHSDEPTSTVPRSSCSLGCGVRTRPQRIFGASQITVAAACSPHRATHQQRHRIALGQELDDRIGHREAGDRADDQKDGRERNVRRGSVRTSSQGSILVACSRCDVPRPTVVHLAPRAAAASVAGAQTATRISPPTEETCMKLYYHPVSTVSRPDRAVRRRQRHQARLPDVIDLMTGEHMKEEYAAINPSRLVPVLEDGDFRLTESSAILKYLADKIQFAGLPEGPQEARAGERDDGLAQHRLLSRLRLRPRVSADLPAPSPPQRRSAGGDGRVGQGEVEVLAARSSTNGSSAPARNTCAATRSRSPTTWARAWCR